MKAEMKKKTATQSVRTYLKEKNINFTIERDAMFNVLRSMKGRYSAEDFYKIASKRNAICARTTVYRVMPLFVRAGVVREICLPNGRKHYETSY